MSYFFFVLIRTYLSDINLLVGFNSIPMLHIKSEGRSDVLNATRLLINYRKGCE